jgi:hypothetical protein
MEVGMWKNILVPLLLVIATPGSAEMAGEWRTEFYRAADGTNGPVYASCSVPELGEFVAGHFTYVGGLYVANIFQAFEAGVGGFDCDATYCEAVGGGLMGSVHALASYQGKLYAGGAFSGNFACWDGSMWTYPGSWDGEIRTLKVIDGVLYIGGNFSGVMRSWDGVSFTELPGADLLEVLAIEPFGGQIVVGGYPTEFLPMWDGSQWTHVDWGLIANGVYAMAAYDDKLYLGGDLWLWSGDWFSCLGYWDGSGVHGVGEISPGTVHSLLAPESGGGALLVGGSFAGEGDRHDNLGHWNGDSWVTYPSMGGTDGPVYSLSGEPIKAMIGGDFDHYDDVETGNIVEAIPAWGQTRYYGWRGEGLNRSGNSLALHEGDVVVGGPFQAAGEKVLGGVARWGAGGWNPLGEGLVQFCFREVLDLYSWQGDLYATVAANGVHRWDGVDWSSFGADIDGWMHKIIDYQGALHVGGSPGYGSDPVVRWEDPDWVPLGTGIDGADSPRVKAFAVHDGDLYAGGHFDSAGGQPAANIARWDGATWHPLGEGCDGDVEVLYSDGNRLIAAGDFVSAGGSPASRVAVWQDNAWSPLGEGVTGTVRAIVRLEGHLLIGGNIEVAGISDSQDLFVWRDTEWRPLFPGLEMYVNDLVVRENRLWVTGSIIAAGEVPSHNVAVFEASPTTVEGDDPAGGMLTLKPVYPNPFNPQTTVSFTLGVEGPVRLSIHDVQGRRLRVLVDRALPIGDHDFTWDGRDESGRELPSGVYFSRLEAEGEVQSGKLVLSR